MKILSKQERRRNLKLIEKAKNFIAKHENDPTPSISMAKALVAERRYCHGCGDHNDAFMVTDDVWQLSGFPTRHWLSCLPCLEKGIDRKLTVDDFTDAPINESIFFAYGMGRRSTLGDSR